MPPLRLLYPFEVVAAQVCSPSDICDECVILCEAADGLDGLTDVIVAFAVSFLRWRTRAFRTVCERRSVS